MKTSLLILDDAIDKLSSHIDYLERMGWVVTKATTLPQAMKLCKQQLNYDCVIVDIKMLFENDKRVGIEFVSKLIDEFHFTKPIVFFTVLSKDNDERIYDLMKKPFVHYLQKGVTVTQFYESIKGIIDQSHSDNKSK